MIEIWRKITKKLIGVGGEPDGDNYDFNTEILVIEGKHKENFEEYMADEYGNQDYSYGVEFHMLCELEDWEFEDLKKVMANK